MQQGVNQVIHDMIVSDISHSYHSLSQEKKGSLIQIATSFYENKITLKQAKEHYSQFTPDTNMLDRLQLLKEIDENPYAHLQRLEQIPKSTITRARKRSFPWSDAEDLRLICAVNRYGARDWKQIAEFVGNGRTSSQCNQRWCRAIDPQIVRSGWTPDEDSQLLRAVEVLGKTSWCQVAKILPGRTDLQCRYRFLQLNRNSDHHPNSPAQSEPAAQPTPSPAVLDVNQVKYKRRNSIPIAQFTIPPDTPPTGQLPYYLDSDFHPYNQYQSVQCLHRVPPLLSGRINYTPPLQIETK